MESLLASVKCRSYNFSVCIISLTETSCACIAVVSTKKEIKQAIVLISLEIFCIHTNYRFSGSPNVGVHKTINGFICILSEFKLA